MKIKIHFCRDDSLIPYIKSGKLLHTDNIQNLKTINKSSIINKTRLAEFGDVIIKSTVIPASFNLVKRTEQRLRLKFIRPALRDAKCASAALKLGIDTYTPLAVWDTIDSKTVSSHILYTFVDGTPILDIFNRHRDGSEPKEKFLEILMSLGAIARKLHDGGIIHKDLAPRNVLIKPDGRLALLDFASGYTLSNDKSAITEAVYHYSLTRLLRLLNKEEITVLAKAYTLNDPDEKKSKTLKQLIFWQNHSLKGRGGIHFFSHLANLIKAATIR